MSARVIARDQSLTPGQVLLRRRRDQRPAAGVQRLVDAFPAEVRRALGAGVAQLHADVGVAVRVHPVDDARPRVALRVGVQARAALGDAGVGADAGHLRHHQRRAAHRAGAQVHEVVVADDAVDGRVLRHRRDDDAVLQRDRAHRERREHRRDRLRGATTRAARRLGRSTWWPARAALREPALVALEPAGVAQAQVLVADALAARQQRVHELLGLQRIAVARAADLEPFHRVPRGVLQAQHLDGADGLVAIEQRGQIAARVVAGLLELVRQFDRVLQRELGARADREVRGVHGVAHQHDRRVAGSRGGRRRPTTART